MRECSEDSTSASAKSGGGIGRSSRQIGPAHNAYFFRLESTVFMAFFDNITAMGEIKNAK
jgi:hypothetical protein